MVEDRLHFGAIAWGSGYITLSRSEANKEAAKLVSGDDPRLGLLAVFVALTLRRSFEGTRQI